MSAVNDTVVWIDLVVGGYGHLLMEGLFLLLLWRIEIESRWRLNISNRNCLLGSRLMHCQSIGDALLPIMSLKDRLNRHCCIRYPIDIVCGRERQDCNRRSSRRKPHYGLALFGSVIRRQRQC